MGHKIRIIILLLQIQVYKSEARYCKEAVASVALVTSCPTSKSEWDIAAHKKNCSEIASQQNCASVDMFSYHCVINGYRNETLEVCAPSRIIFGHCVEFNLLGGVIQDQWSSPCNETFPKCDLIYDSTAAYKYPDCYQLVSINFINPETAKMPVTKMKDITTTKTITTTYLVIPISIILISASIVFIQKAVKMVVRGRRPVPKFKENVGLTSTDTDIDKIDDDTMQPENRILKPGFWKKSYLTFLTENESTKNPLKLWKYRKRTAYIQLLIESGTLVYDLDTYLTFPCDLKQYYEEAIKDNKSLKPEYHRMFRVIPAAEYLKTFASDRLHMLTPDGRWKAPPPSYPPIKTEECSDNLQEFISMEGNGHGVVLSLSEFLNRFLNS